MLSKLNDESSSRAIDFIVQIRARAIRTLRRGIVWVTHAAALSHVGGTGWECVHYEGCVAIINIKNDAL